MPLIISCGNSVEEFLDETRSYQLGGTVTGLEGTGLALTLTTDTIDNLQVTENSFTFGYYIINTAYTVSVTAQPTSPSQTCEISAGENDSIHADSINDISVICTTNSFTIAGNVTGLTDDGLGIALNDLPTITVNVQSPNFTFAPLKDQSAYEVTIRTQPANQTCRVATESDVIVSAGTGKLAGVNIDNIGIHCVDNYFVGGIVTGLDPSSTIKLVLQNNAADNLTVTTSPFTFKSAIPSGESYNVTVLTQPDNPRQTCTVNADTNNKLVQSSNVTSVAVVCSTNQYSISGVVEGQLGSGLTLNNAGQQINVSGTEFMFAPQADGSTYLVTIGNQPAGQNCVVSGGNGKLSGAAITSVRVICNLLPLNFAATFAVKQLNFSWNAIPNIDYFQILENPDGVSGFQLLPGSGDLTGNSYSHELAVHLFDQTNARYRLEAYEIQGSIPVLVNSSNDLAITDLVSNAVGFIKSPKPSIAGAFGVSVSLSSDGHTLAVGSNGVLGKVDVLSQNSDGSWPVTPGHTIQPRNPALFDRFGDSISLSNNGGVLAIGAPDRYAGTIANAGEVYIATQKRDGSWSGIAGNSIVAPSPITSGNFGTSISLSGDGRTLAIVAYRLFSGTSNLVEVVYIFNQNSDGSWPAAPDDVIELSSILPGSALGARVSFSSDGRFLAIGAPSVNGGAGVVYIINQNSNGSWPTSPGMPIQASITAANDFFGGSISLSGDGHTLAVGAKGTDIGVNADVGAVYILYQNSDGSWPSSPGIKILAPIPSNANHFGVDVSLSGDGNFLAVGGWSRTSINNFFVGEAYILTRNNNGGWSTSLGQRTKTLSSAALDLFGRNVSLNGDGRTLAVGASGEDTSAEGSGAAYLF